VKAAYRRIAKNLALDEDTVRKRVEKLKEAGLIQGWALIVNPHLLGMTIFAIWMNINPQLSVQEAIRKISLVRGVLSIAHEVGDIVGVGLLCENEEVFNKRLELIAELVGARNVTTFGVRYPKPNLEFTKTDWDLIEKLRVNPSVRYNQLAKELGISSKTITRRLNKMIEGKGIFFVPEIDFKRLEGVLCINLFVFYTASEYKAEVDENVFSKFQDYVFRAGWGNPTHGHFTLLVPSVAVAQEVFDWVRILRGVREARINFVYDWAVFYDEALDEILRTKGDLA
jgi:DNA-binding Lrp family transcriptional regulator